MISTKKLIATVAVAATLTIAGTSFAMMGGGGSHGSYYNHGDHGYSRTHDRYQSMDLSFEYGRYNSNHDGRYQRGSSGHYDENHMRDVNDRHHDYSDGDHMGDYDGRRRGNSHNYSEQHIRYRYGY